MDRDALFDAFKIAIDKEYEAREFYKDLAEKTDDGELKELFERFSEEEHKHFTKLKSLYAGMTEQGP